MKLKNVIIFLCVIIALVVSGYFVADYWVNKKLTDFLETEKSKGHLAYTDFSLDLLKGKLSIDSLSYTRNQNIIVAEAIDIKGVSYIRYFLNDHINIQAIELKKPVIEITTNSDSGFSAQQKKIDYKITVEDLQIEQGKFSLNNKKTDKPLNIENFTIRFEDIVVNEKTLQQKIPFTYNNYNLKINRLSYKLNKLQKIATEKILVTPKEAIISNFQLKPNYTRQEYIKVIPYEKDLMELQIDSLSIKDYTFDFEVDTTLFKTPKITLSKADFDIYRDKTVRDDPNQKPLYSKMLRDLPLKIAVDSLFIKHTSITYEERIYKDRKPGKVNFERLNAKISNLTNIAMHRKDFPKTEINISSYFMGVSPIDVHWNFSINNPLDQFRIRGKSFKIPPKSINSFFTPAFNAKAEGSIDEVYFDFEGNNNTANGKMILNYNNFSVEILRKDGKERNKILSLIANIFVKKRSAEGRKTHQVEQVKRNKTKSFWNYFWSCLQAGLKKSFL